MIRNRFSSTARTLFLSLSLLTVAIGGACNRASNPTDNSATAKAKKADSSDDAATPSSPPQPSSVAGSSAANDATSAASVDPDAASTDSPEADGLAANDSSPQSPAAQSPDTQSSDASSDTQSSDPSSELKPSEVSEGDPNDAAAGAETEVAGSTTKDSDEQPEPEPTRILLLSAEGPLLLDMYVEIDGQTQAQVVEKLIDEVMTIADTDGDGVVTWDEAMNDPDLASGQYGNTVPESAEQRKQLMYGYDITRNGRMDRDEVMGFLNSRGRHLIDVSGVYTEERPQPPLLTWLDIDKSGALEASELAKIVERARVLDRNDDWMIARSELPGEQNVSSPQRRRRSNRNAPRTVAVLVPDMDWGRLLFSIEERYAYGSPIQASDLMREAMFEKLDTDQDGYWSRSEVEGLMELPADSTMHLSFGESPQLKVEATQTVAGLQLGADALTARFQFASTPLDFELRDEAGSPYGSDEQFQRIWELWDTTTDGYLDADEYAAVQGAFFQLEFAAVDADGDEKIVPDEAIEVLLRRQAAQRSRIRLEVDPDESLLWNRIDRNQDDRLSERELRDAHQQLAKLVGDDGTLDPDRLMSGVRVRIARGGGDQRFNVPGVDDEAEGREVSVDGPEWFTQMDRNRDGELARHEFLGTTRQFDELDKDESGFIEPNEAE